MQRPAEVALAVTVCFLVAGCARNVVYTFREPPPEPAAMTPTVPSTTTRIVTTGSAIARGTVLDNSGVDTHSSPGPDAATTASVTLAGPEDGRGCGSQHRASQASATATFTPQPIPTLNAFGFALAVSTRAQGGFWRSGTGGPFNFCTNSNSSDGTAIATANSVSQVLFTTRGSAEIVERLVVQKQLSGDAATTSTSLSDGSGTLLVPLQSTPAVDIYELSRAGTYALTHTLQTQSAFGGACCSGTSAATSTVRVTPLREVLRLALHDSLSKGFGLQITAVVPITAIDSLVRTALFSTDARYYPCRANTELCKGFDGNARDLYLESPSVSVENGALKFSAHLSGNGHWWKFSPGLTGTIQLFAVPQVQNDAIVFPNVVLVVETKNEVVKAVLNHFHDELAAILGTPHSFGLDSAYSKALQKVGTIVPIQAGPVCLVIDVKQIRLLSIGVVSQPVEGLLGYVEIATLPGSPEKCAQSAHPRLVPIQ